MMAASTWEEKTLGEIGDTLIGLTYSPSQVTSAGALVLRSSNIQNGRLDLRDVVYVNADVPAKIRVRRSDVLICVRNGSRSLIGKSLFLDERVDGETFGAFMAVFRSPLNEYLRFFFQSDAFKRQVDEHLGATINQITNRSLKSFRVLIPPAVDRAIVAEVLTDVSEQIEHLQLLIAKKHAIKQGVTQQLLTGKIRLPGFTGLWTARKIGDFAEVKSGGTPPTAVTRYWGGTVRWMSSGEIHHKRVDEVSGRITADGLRESSAQLLPVGTVLMALAGQGKTRGTVAVSRVELSTNQSIAGILPSDEHDSNFLYYNLDTRYSELRGESAGDGGRGGLNLTIIKKLEVLMPNVVEQQAIASVLTAIDDEIDALERRLVSTRRIKQGMMQELLSGRTRLKPVEVAA